MTRHAARTFSTLVVLILAARCVGAEPPATQPIEPSQFIRFKDDADAGGALQTAVVTYRNQAGQTLQLVAAIHIAEKDYFQRLNARFEKQDAVLYELVKAKDGPLPQPGVETPAAEGNPISQLQHFMKDVLNLSFQLDVIDYTRPNFVHADLDKEAFEKLQAERGESIESLMLQQMLKAFNSAPKEDDAQPQDVEQGVDQIIHLLTRPDMERQIKLVVARQINELQEKGMGLDGMSNTVILGERNAAAIKVLKSTVEQQKRNIAVFYGAAHMPGLSAEVKKLGFEPVSCEWETAWDLKIRPNAPSAVEQLLHNAFKSLEDDQ